MSDPQPGLSADLRSELKSVTLAPEALEALERLGERPWSADFYLAGGAALALHLGHRAVRDLDLMSAANRLAPSEHLPTGAIS